MTRFLFFWCSSIVGNRICEENRRLLTQKTLLSNINDLIQTLLRHRKPGIDIVWTNYRMPMTISSNNALLVGLHSLAGTAELASVFWKSFFLMPRPQNETSLNAIRVLFQVSVVYVVGRLGIQDIIKVESITLKTRSS